MIKQRSQNIHEQDSGEALNQCSFLTPGQRRFSMAPSNPLPGIAVARPTNRILKAGYLTWPGDRSPQEAERRKDALDEIYGYNPLLFDFVMKRTIRVNGRKLPDSVFGALPEPGATACSLARR